jgi:hypothetical protein
MQANAVKNQWCSIYYFYFQSGSAKKDQQVPGACYQRLILTSAVIKLRIRWKDDHERWAEKNGRVLRQHLPCSEILTAVATKSYIFWDIPPCSPVKVDLHFGGTYRLHLHDRRVSQERNMHEAGSKQNYACCIRPWKSWRHVPPKCRLTSTGLYGTWENHEVHHSEK